MEPKIAQFINKGMQQDYSISKASNEFAFKNHNIRITTRGDNSLLTVTNEKSNKRLPVYKYGDSITVRWNDNEKRYVKMSFDTPRKLSKITINCEGTWLQSAFRVQFKKTFEITFDGNKYSEFLFKDYIDNYIEKEIKITKVLDIKLWADTSLPYEEVSEPKQFDGIGLKFYILEPLKGIVIGHCVTNDNIILYSTDNEYDYIYLCTINEALKLLYKGKLGFSVEYPIETLFNYESENVQKVYWVDGINRPRVINIKGNIQQSNDSQFDFNPVVINPEVSITRADNGIGVFPSGTIQYIVTYYNNFMQESAPAYISPIYYLSKEDRGASPEENVNCSFNIKISNLDTNWDNIRVYSIIRSSLNSTALGYLVADKPLKTEDSEDTITIIDNGSNQESVDATSFLFNSDDFIPSTIAKKSDQLFFGNIKTKDINSLSEEVEEQIRSACTLKWEYKSRPVSILDSEALYPYKSQLNYSEEDIKGFKYNETYRFAVQFQNSRGVWGEPIYLEDTKNTLYPTQDNIPVISATIDTSKISDFIENENIVNARLLRAELDDSNRTIVAQGILSPTVYNLAEVVNNNCRYANSWVQRFTGFDAHLRNVNYKNEEKNAYFNREVPIEKDSFLEYDLEKKATSHESDNRNNTPVFAKINKFTLKFIYFYGRVSYKSYICFAGYDLHISLLNSDKVLISTLEESFVSNAPFREFDGVAKNKDKFLNKVKEAYYLTLNDVIRYTITEETYNVILTKINSNLDSSTVTQIVNLSVDEKPFFSEDTLSEEYERIKLAYITYEKDKETFGYIDAVTTKEIPGKDFNTVTNSNKTEIKNTALRNQYFTDATTVSMYSPNIDKVISDNLKFRIIGYSELRNNISSFTIDVNSDTKKGDTTDFGFNDFNTKNYLYSHYLWASNSIKNGESSIDFGYPWIGLWQQSGSLSNTPNEDILKRKVIGNLWYCDTKFDLGGVKFSGTRGINSLKLFKDSPIYLGGNIYKGNYNYTLIPVKETGFDYQYNVTVPPQPLDIVENGSITTVDSSEYNSCNIKYSSTPHAIFRLNKGEDGKTLCLPGYEKMGLGGYETRVLSTGELLNTESIIDNTKEKCYIYPFIHQVVGNISKAPYEVSLQIAGGQYNTGVKVPVEIGAYVIVALYTLEDALEAITNMYLNNPSMVDHVYTVFVDVVGRGDIIPYPERVSDIEFHTTISVLSNICKYKLYRVTDTSTKNYLRCVSPDNNLVVSATPDRFVEYYKDKNFIGVGGGIPGFSSILYSGGNCKIYYKPPLATLDAKFVYLEDEKIIGEIYSNDIYDNLPSASEEYFKDTKCVLLGELYRDLPEQYGGTSPAALANTKYVSCSNSYNINNTDSLVINNTYGDTYYQRWDCLRTYPTTEEDINSVVDVVSVMVESYTNLDGRYDSNRGRLDVHNSRPTNMNLINSAYSQTNNFFTIYDLDDRIKNSNLGNCYTWSLKKTNNELVDSWTKGLLVNVNALDGSKGKLTKLQLWKDYLLAFQENGIARIHYNDQTTISSMEGIPVEIANSTKVSGHNYLSETTGCPNKWSMATSEAGIYFVDNHNSIDLFNGNVNSLSYTKSFKDWALNNLNSTIWNPNNNGYYGSYDHLHHDYYITNGDNCLCYSEELQAFTSFYDYNRSPIMFNLDNKFLGLETRYGITKLWAQFEGDDYCNFYGEQKDYSVEYNVNPEPLKDKVFTNLEYRAYVDNSNDTFDKLTVNNEYQHGETNINSISRFKYPNAEKKFRIWRLDIPRDSNSKHKLDRIRNPWIKLKLTKNTNTNNRMDFHNLIVKYFE